MSTKYRSLAMMEYILPDGWSKIEEFDFDNLVELGWRHKWIQVLLENGNIYQGTLSTLEYHFTDKNNAVIGVRLVQKPQPRKVIMYRQKADRYFEVYEIDLLDGSEMMLATRITGEEEAGELVEIFNIMRHKPAPDVEIEEDGDDT